MNAETCLKKLQLVGVLSFATVGLDGAPQVRCISAIHYGSDAVYFFTARGKSLCRELLKNDRVQMLAYTKYKEMIRVSGKAEPMPKSLQDEYINLIFDEQPYLANVYPGDTRKIGIVFAVRDIEIEYFNLGVKPIFRETYTLGDVQSSEKGYRITNDCIGCGRCKSLCPQSCIKVGKPYEISQEHCLRCGSCFENCPVAAVIRME